MSRTWIFRNRGESPLVGDFVEYSYDGESDGSIEKILQRNNELVRPPIANIDQALLVFSAKEPDFNTILLDRFLVVLESFHVQPIIILTKMDLVNDKEREQLRKHSSMTIKIGYDIIETYIDDPTLIEKIQPIYKGKHRACWQSCRKINFIKYIIARIRFKTGIISKSLGRGKHTTRHVELIEVCGGLLADTPGFSSFDFDTIEKEELSACLPEFERISENCKFRGCLHIKEPKCAVKQAVESGEIRTYRYEHYEQFLQEIIDRKPRY